MEVYVISFNYKSDNIALDYSDNFYNVSIRVKEAVLNMTIKLKGGKIVWFTVDTDSNCFSVDGNLFFCSIFNEGFNLSAANPFVPSVYSWSSAFFSKITNIFKWN